VHHKHHDSFTSKPQTPLRSNNAIRDNALTAITANVHRYRIAQALWIDIVSNEQAIQTIDVFFTLVQGRSRHLSRRNPNRKITD